MLSKNTVCLWFNGTAVEAAQFYAETFPKPKPTACGMRLSETAAKRAFEAMMQIVNGR